MESPFPAVQVEPRPAAFGDLPGLTDRPRAQDLIAAEIALAIM
jgi:hypothetical protein